jgi:hypothetical protein
MGTRPVKQDFATKKAWEEEKVEFSKKLKIYSLWVSISCLSTLCRLLFPLHYAVHAY